MTNEYLIKKAREKIKRSKDIKDIKETLDKLLEKITDNNSGNNSGSSERSYRDGPIGPGYYVGGRRFDLDGLPADD